MILASVIATTVETTSTTNFGIVYLLPSFVIGLVLAYIKCDNYNCSIKYGLLTGFLVGLTLGAIDAWFFVSSGVVEPYLNKMEVFIPVYLNAVVYNIVLGVLGSLIGYFLKNTFKK